MGINLPDFKTVVLEERYIDQWNRIERPEIDPHNYVQLILTKL